MLVEKPYTVADARVEVQSGAPSKKARVLRVLIDDEVLYEQPAPVFMTGDTLTITIPITKASQRV